MISIDAPLKLNVSPLSFIDESIKKFIENVDTTLIFFELDSYLIPCSVNFTEYTSSYVTSNYYVIEHLKHSFQNKWWLSPLTLIGGGALKGVRINRCVQVNNWLMTNAIYPPLSFEALKRLIVELSRQYPSHYLMFRNLNTKTCASLIEDLKKLGAHLFFSREVYLFDPKKKLSSKARYHFRRDQRLLESGCYKVLTEQHIPSASFERLIELYTSLYIGKFSSFSPRYTQKFLKGAVQSGWLKLRVLLYNDTIVGVIGFSMGETEMVLPFFGYDQTHPASPSIYRVLLHIAIKESIARNVLLNDGTGGDTAKKNRGMTLYKEYSALYCQHLSWGYRLFWKLASFFH